MKIYTRTGDNGTTSLFGGSRVPKSHIRLDAYGTIDELNSWMGLLRDQPVNEKRCSEILEIQDRLFTIGSRLATEQTASLARLPSIDLSDSGRLEAWMDRMDEVLPPLRSFVLPGGHPSVSFGHVSRTVCRRAERLVIALHEVSPVDELLRIYLNRLSDYLFVLCRIMALELGVKETPWEPRR